MKGDKLMARQKKSKNTVVAMDTDSGNAIVLSEEQVNVCSNSKLWAMSDKELKALIGTSEVEQETDGAVSILAWRKKHSNETELEKLEKEASLKLEPLRKYISTFTSENGALFGKLFTLQNKERVASGKDEQESLNIAFSSLKPFTLRVNGIETFFSIGAGMTVTAKVGKRSLKKLSQDAMQRLAWKKQAEERQAEIERKWNEYEEQGVENADRW